MKNPCRDFKYFLHQNKLLLKFQSSVNTLRHPHVTWGRKSGDGRRPWPWVHSALRCPHGVHDQRTARAAVCRHPGRSLAQGFSSLPPFTGTGALSCMSQCDALLLGSIRGWCLSSEGKETWLVCRTQVKKGWICRWLSSLWEEQFFSSGWGWRTSLVSVLVW